MLNEKTRKLESVAAENEIALHKNFNLKYLSAHAFYEAPAELAERIEDMMLSLCYNGINGGFDNSLRLALEKMSALVVSLTETESGNTKELVKIETAAEKAAASVKSELKGGDVRDDIRKYIDTAVSAADAVTALYGEGEIFAFIDERQLARLNESKTKFGGLSHALMGVLDVTSAAGAEYAEKITELIKAWRADCAGFMCSSDSIAKLDEAIKAAEEWQKLTKAPARREKAKNMPKYSPDDITLLGESKSSLEKLSVFNARIESEIKEIEKRESELSALIEKRDGLVSELGQVQKEEKAIVSEFKNTGDLAKANREVSVLARKKESITAEINRLERGGGIERKKVDLQGRKLTCDALREVYDMLSENRSDPVFLARAARAVDFNALAAMFTGRFNAQDVAKATDSIRNIRARIDILNENRGAMLETLNLEAQTTASVLNGTESLKNAVGETYGKTGIPQDGMSDELRRLMEMYGGEESEKEKETAAADGELIPLDDDDK